MLESRDLVILVYNYTSFVYLVNDHLPPIFLNNCNFNQIIYENLIKEKLTIVSNYEILQMNIILDAFTAKMRLCACEYEVCSL